MPLCHRLFATLILVLATTTPIDAQVATATPPFASFGGGPDTINLADLNAHWTIPVFSRAGRGGGFNYNLSYDSSVWYPSASTWQPVTNWGWTSSTAAVSGRLYYGITSTGICPYQNGKLGIGYNGRTYTYINFSFYDDLGSRHAFSGSAQVSYSYSPSCTAPPPVNLTTTVNDGSGYTLQVIAGSSSVYNSKGTLVGPPINAFAGPGTLTDRNGNIISVDNSGNITDTLGTVALVDAGSGTPSSPITFTYTAPSGGSVAHTVKYTTYSVRTNFGCSGIVEYGANGTTTANLASEIDLPDGSKYTFGYEATPGYSGFVTGRLASITLPTGGTIRYTYTGGNNGINCSDGSTATLTRTTPDGTWTYAQVKGSGAASTTTITDPQGNVTTIQFQGIYETQRIVKQGSSTVLQTTNTCYNGASIPCTGTAITLPITSRTVSNVLGGGNLTDQHVFTYDGYGNLLTASDYDYGGGARGNLLEQTTITYASLGNIIAFRQQVTVTDGGGHTVSQTNYNYDQGTVTATSGTPQHTSISGSRGNLTSVNYYTQGSTYLTKSYTYFDTGNVQTATDVNGAQMSYTYGTCGNSFPTSVSETWAFRAPWPGIARAASRPR